VESAEPGDLLIVDLVDIGPVPYTPLQSEGRAAAMDGIHDTGGKNGYGPVGYQATEPVFHEEWEGRAFAILGYLHAQGISNWDKSRWFRETMGNENYVNELEKSYYSHWLNAVERLLVSEGVITEEERSERVQAIRDGSYKEPTPEHAADELGEQAVEDLQKPKSLRLEGPTPSFSEGDEVVVQPMNPSGHTRSPGYLRGHRGRVLTSHGPQSYPDSKSAGLGDDPRPLYTVGFEAREVWGDDGGPRDMIYADLWEPYLTRAS